MIELFDKLEVWIYIVANEIFCTNKIFWWIFCILWICQFFVWGSILDRFWYMDFFADIFFNLFQNISLLVLKFIISMNQWRSYVRYNFIHETPSCIIFRLPKDCTRHNFQISIAWFRFSHKTIYVFLIHRP